MTGRFDDVFVSLNKILLVKHIHSRRDLSWISRERNKQRQFLTASWLIHDNISTPSKINMEPENDGLEGDIPFHLGR